ncbi:MAG: hypothetical protein CVU54_03660 [Deltaproteobacteria bacterium HGW-Deltaproteobacteria-12]|nr:MAG: hypothetical protein CVU54_03660 [Deltaproteobacteria bacterium HGW-Deltaproteobacteria-12]
MGSSGRNACICSRIYGFEAFSCGRHDNSVMAAKILSSPIITSLIIALIGCCSYWIDRRIYFVYSNNHLAHVLVDQQQTMTVNRFFHLIKI